jgi:urea ABC transporter substrate-binding protein
VGLNPAEPVINLLRLARKEDAMAHPKLQPWCLGFLAIAVATGTASSTRSTEAADPIKLCIIDDHSGDLAGPVRLKTIGYNLAVKEINDRGGVLERPLELVFYDGQTDVKRHQELTQKCILDDEVDVVMAGATSSEREAARAVAVKNKMIYWHNNQGEGGIADHYSFFTGPIPEQQILPGVEYMIDKYGPRMYILAADYGFGQVSALWTHAAAGLYGGEVVGEEFIPLGNSEFASTITNLQTAKPDFVVSYLVGGAQYNFFPQAAAAGLRLPAVSTVSVTLAYEHKIYAAPALADMHIPLVWIEELPGEVPQSFVQRAREIAPDADYISEATRSAYIAVNLMAMAWERAGTTETEAVIDELESGLSFEAPEGHKVFLDPATHHLSMHMVMGRVDENHNVPIVADFGVIEPWWLRSLGVNLVRQDEARQFLPFDDPRLARYKPN